MTKTLIAIISLIFTSAAHCATEPATSVYGREQFRVMGLVSLCIYYSEQHGGKLPDTLEELRNMVNLPDVLKLHPSLGDFGERHSFIKGDLHIADNVRVVTVSARPDYKFTEFEGLEGRIVGYIDISGKPAAHWVPESDIQNALKNSPNAHILPPMGPTPAPTIELRKYRPPTDDQLRVLEANGVKLKIDAEGKPLEESVDKVSASLPKDSSTEPKPAEIPAPAPTPAPTSPTKESANLVWWIVGLIILVAGMVFVTRKKTPKA